MCFKTNQPTNQPKNIFKSIEDIFMQKPSQYSLEHIQFETIPKV